MHEREMYRFVCRHVRLRVRNLPGDDLPPERVLELTVEDPLGEEDETILGQVRLEDVRRAALPEPVAGEEGEEEAPRDEELWPADHRPEEGKVS